MINEILMLFVYVPGSAELIFLLITFFILRRKSNEDKLLTLTKAVFITAFAGFIVWTMINLAWKNAPLKPLQYLLIGGWAFDVLRKRNPLLMKLVLPVAIVMYSVFTWQFTFARNELSAKVLCLGVDTPVVASLSYHYGKLAGYHFSEVNGKKWSLGDEWPQCDQPQNIPQYYFGIRGLTFSHM